MKNLWGKIERQEERKKSNHKNLLVEVGFLPFYELIYIKWGNPTKQDFPAIISTVEYSSGYLLLNARV